MLYGPAIEKMQSALLASVLLVCSAAAQAGVEAHTSFYLDAYGPANPSENKRVEQAQIIFNRLKKTAGQSVSSARLIVINSSSNPWAVALADGNVVLSEGALNIIYEGFETRVGDARLAFVLGHELAHLANRDLWHHRVFANISGDSGTQALKEVRRSIKASAHNLEEVRQRELKADEVGFVYASLAGFETDTLLGDENEHSFLHDWVVKTQTWVDNEHHDPDVRTSFLSNRLTQMRYRVALFNYGVRLAHFGRFEDSIYFLDAFRRDFPSRQVLSNLGYVHIQLARKAMSPAIAYRFWYPTLLETHSGVPELARQFPKELPAKAIDHLSQAVALLDEATRVDQDDIVSRLNLIAAYLYLGKPFNARAVIEDALQKWPDSVQLTAMRALVLLDQEPQVDMWSHVTSQLQSIINDIESPPDNLVYNLAMLYAERGRHGRASALWSKLLARLHELPENFQTMVCSEAGQPPVCNDLKQKKASNRWLNKRFSLPVTLGTDMDSKEARNAMKSWTEKEWTVGPFSVRIFENANHGSILALDHHAELIVMRSDTMPSPTGLKLEYGDPDIMLPLGSGIVWSYGTNWSAFLEQTRVAELWIARQ